MEEVGDLDSDEPEGNKAVEDESNKWEELANKYEKLAEKVSEQLEDENDEIAHEPPAIKIPSQPTRDQWDMRQITHTI